jgi:hypothetical protein
MSFFGNLTSLTDNLDLNGVRKNFTERASQMQANFQAASGELAGRLEAITGEVRLHIDWFGVRRVKVHSATIQTLVAFRFSPAAKHLQSVPV